MANRPARFCEEPGCPLRVRPPLRRCAEHRSSHARRRLKPAGAFRVYDSPRWRALVRQVRREEPVCRRCKVTPTADVDHILELEDGGAPYDRTNLQGMCRPCHRIKTAEAARARRAKASA